MEVVVQLCYDYVFLFFDDVCLRVFHMCFFLRELRVDYELR
jgi:hypothetical protein